jgi:hypothetical protein
VRKCILLFGNEQFTGSIRQACFPAQPRRVARTGLAFADNPMAIKSGGDIPEAHRRMFRLRAKNVSLRIAVGFALPEYILNVFSVGWARGLFSPAQNVYNSP